MTKKQESALKNVQSILQRNFHQSLVSVVYADGKDGMKVKIHTMDGCANNEQSEHLARTTLNNIEIITCGLIKTTFDVAIPVRHVKETKSYPTRYE